MPQDPNLYGQRPAKKQKQKRAMALTDTLDFAAQLRSLMATKPEATSSTTAMTTTTTTTTTTAPVAATPLVLSTTSSRRRQEDPLARVRIKRRRPVDQQDDGGGNGSHGGSGSSSRLRLKSPPGGSAAAGALDANERDRVRRHMEAKARRYAALQRGDAVARQGEAAPLVDFDRKWAERRGRDRGSGSDSQSESEADDDDDDNDHDLVEYEDEYGRTRHVTRSERDRLQRRRDRAERAARALDDMRARPAPPPADGHGEAGRRGIIHGDVIQTEAFETAPDRGDYRDWANNDNDNDNDNNTHYKADEDVRTRGAAFYAFAADDEAARAAQMQALAAERTRTEAARAASAAKADGRRQQLDARRRLLDERRAALAARRAHQQADSFLDGLEQDLLGSTAGETGGRPETTQ